ncbi:hypothetical protein ABWL48_15775, partial [Streptococcus suis]
ILSNTKIFIIYGMSLGITDRTWWNLVAKECINQEGYIIIHQYKKGFTGKVAFEVVDEREKVKQLFLDRCHTLSQEEKELLKERIFVAFNETIFVSMELMKAFEEVKKDAI